MKQFKIVCIYSSILYICHTHADSNLESYYCYNDKSSECKVQLKKEKEINETNYSVSLIDTIKGNQLFPEIETNSTMESVSLYKVNDKYVLSNEYFGASGTIELFTFKYTKGKPHNIQYYYLESSINVEKRTKEWSGAQCSHKHHLLPKGNGETLLSRLSLICEGKAKLTYNNTYINNDVLFDMIKITDGHVEGNITAIALASKDSDKISISDIGCKSNCSLNSNAANYIGTLNGKIRIKLHLDIDKNNITGYYYYDKIKKKIKISGEINGDKLNLYAETTEGKETFNGVINDGQFTGIWKGLNKIYPFSLYLMLIQ